MKVVFLLGAGASKPAGVPLVEEFVRDFKATLAPERRKLLESLEERLSSTGRTVDVELVLEALERVRALALDTTAALLGATQLAVGGTVEDLEEMGRLLKRYIRHRCAQVKPENVRYLAPLVSFARMATTLDIFSLNYDMCVEMLAETEGLSYTDGFELFWSPQRLDDEGTSLSPLIRLHKIHGSVVWFLRKNFRYVKIPLLPRSDSEELQYFTHENVSEMMLYPALTKSGEIGPYPELMHRFRASLRAAEIMVSIGYRFRDEAVRKLVQEAVFANPRLQVFLVSPSAAQIKTEIFGEPALITRVISIPDKVESILPSGRLHNEISTMQSALNTQDHADAMKPAAYNLAKQQYRSVVQDYRRLDQLDAVKAIVEREESENPVKASDLNTHLLPDPVLCVQFALMGGEAAKLWWRLASLAMYWWENYVSHRIRSWKNIEPIRVRPGFPGISQGDQTAVEDTALVPLLVSLTAYASSTGPKSISVLIRQAERIGRIQQICGLSWTNVLEAEIVSLIHDYNVEPGVSEITAQLAH